ncbi:uncharacterized protein LOC141728081 isoform X2 [Zonotrichia albicollis]|uniref:uncharacterized protein LOC141728081 isoform X2 n=1 Tax=Zonotrichia albicollis TaxID=44394 RepID=UPI003D80D18C
MTQWEGNSSAAPLRHRTEGPAERNPAAPWEAGQAAGPASIPWERHKEHRRVAIATGCGRAGGGRGGRGGGGVGRREEEAPLKEPPRSRWRLRLPNPARAPGSASAPGPPSTIGSSTTRYLKKEEPCLKNGYSERSRRRCVGITIETRPDHCLRPHLSAVLGYGCTRLEIGVQSVCEDVARDTNR